MCIRDRKTDSAAVFGNAGLYYVSGENIYICEDDYSGEETEVAQTCIRKIGYKDGVLEAKGQTKIDGILHDSFSIDEYKGNLRLVTTVSQAGNQAVPLLKSGVAEEPGTEIEDSNSLYVLNADLEITGEIHDLAEGEQIYSARFIGDAGYFVTYRQTDPLFSVDLSDAAEPKIIGALKIPGFSEYLHPFGEGKLLGIGMDVDETGTVTNGVKVSMFDISDPSEMCIRDSLGDSWNCFYSFPCDRRTFDIGSGTQPVFRLCFHGKRSMGFPYCHT